MPRSPWFGVARAAVVAAFVYLAWSQSPDFSGVLMLGLIWAIAAVGLALVLGLAGQTMLCQASFMLMGAYAYGWLAHDAGVPTVMALLAAGVAGGLGGALLTPTLRLRGYTFALGTIAAALLVTQVATAGWLPGGNFGLTDIPWVDLGFTTLTSNEQYAWTAGVLLAGLVYALHLTFGRGARSRAVQFIHHDEDLLAFVGGNAVRLKRVLFLVAAVLGGVAGGIYAAAFGFIQPEAFGLLESFALALVVVLGGNGRLMGAVLGALIYQMSFNVLGDEHVELRFALLGAIVIATMHFFPFGLLPARQEFVGWFPFLSRPAPRGSSVVPKRPDGETPLGIELNQVTKRFGALTAVAGVSTVVRPGALVALVGPNGAGKSTLLDVISGARVSSGSLSIGEQDVTQWSTWQRARLGVARTFQQVRLIPSLTVLENALAGADQWVAETGHRYPEADRVAVARDALHQAGLSEREESPIDALSFGERRRVELARAIASRPRLALLDEPSSGLDKAEVAALAELIRRLHLGGCTIVLVEHNLPLVQELAEDVIALDQGALLAHGDTAEVFEAAAFKEAYIGAGV
jgi:branched-chain amino acid transport system permease protein